MSRILTIAGKEFRAAFREKVLLIMAALFLFMSIVSVYVGSTTKNTEQKVYQDIVVEAKTKGEQPPEAPVIYPLVILHNMTEYIVMIGAVLAIFLGFDAFSSERDGGTLRVILARPITKKGLIAGKALGAGAIIGALLLVAFVLNMLQFAVFTGLFPNANETLRLALWMLAALLYMMIFYLFSLLVSIKSRDRAFSFLVMMAAWIGVSFVIPQLVDALRSHAWAVANTAGTATRVSSDTAVSKLIGWFSPAVQFKYIGDGLLQMHSESATMRAGAVLLGEIGRFLYILAFNIVPILFSVRAIKKEDVLC